MFRHITILLKADCYAWWNSIKHDKQAWRKSILKTIGYMIFIISLSVLGWTLFSHLQSIDAPERLLLSAINGFMVFGIIIVAKELMESSLRLLYEAPETPLLYASPIRPVTIFGYKFIQITTARLLSMFCFLGPPWVVFGVIYELPWHFYVALVPVSVCLLVLLASHVSISMMVITRFFSSNVLLKTLKTVGTALGVVVGFLLSFTLFVGSDHFPLKRYLLDLVTTNSTGTSTAWYPHEWISRLLLSWGNETTLWLRMKWMVGGLAITAISVGLALLTSQWIYQRGWENIRQLKSKRKPKRKNGNTATLHLSGIEVHLLRGKIQSLMLKDFLIFIRHTGRVIAIIMLTCFLIFHIMILFSGGYGQDEHSGEILTVQILLYSLLITFGISCNGLRDEAKPWWMMRTAPIKPSLLYTSKYLTALLFTLYYAIFWSLMSVFILRIPTEDWPFMLLTPIIALPVGCALNTTIGTLPWMAELTNQPKPFSRGLTFTVTLFIDVGIVMVPLIAWHTRNTLVFFMMITLLSATFIILYSLGVSNLRRLLVPQE